MARTKGELRLLSRLLEKAASEPGLGSTGCGNTTTRSPEPRDGRAQHREGHHPSEGLRVSIARATAPQRDCGSLAETGLLESVSSLPQLHRQGTELSSEGTRGPPEETSTWDVTTEQPQASSSRPPLYLHSGFPQPASGLCPSERGVIIQLPPGASGPLSAEKFSLRLGPLALCHLWAEDTGKPTLHAGERATLLHVMSPVAVQHTYSKTC